jgi:CRP-like cAMP-binding protein
MSNNKEEFSYLIEILSREGELRTVEELEYIEQSLLLIEDFSKYISRINRVVTMKLCRVIKVEIYDKGSLIFSKGDVSDKYYLVLAGNVDVFNVGSDGTLLPVGKIGKGKQLGERGVVRKIPRSLTAYAGDRQLFLLTITAEDFNSILGVLVYEQLEKKLRFIEQYLPHVSKYSQAQKERIAYVINIETFKRGDVVLEKDSYSDYLYCIFDGECVIKVQSGAHIKNLVKLGTGNCIAEECVLFGKKAYWNVSCSSEICQIGSFKRSDLISLLPDETIESLKSNFGFKVQGRKYLSNLVSQQINIDENAGCENSSRFPNATKYARKRLAEHIARYSSSSPKNSKERLPSTTYSKYKKQLEHMRDCSPTRIDKIYVARGSSVGNDSSFLTLSAQQAAKTNSTVLKTALPERRSRNRSLQLVFNSINSIR